MSEKLNKKGKLSSYVYKKLTEERTYSSDNRHHILNEKEQAALRKIRKRTFWKAGVTGGLAVIILYLPFYIWPEWFPDTQVWIPYYGKYVAVPIIFLIYSMVLLVMEVALLVYFNIHAVKDISDACGYPTPNDPHYETDIEALIAVGLERKQKQQMDLGINPFEGLSKFQLLLFTIAFLMKAALTNFLFKLIVKRLLGRYALRIVMDFVGIPVYAFWNCWAANRVMNETRVRVMAAPIINDLAKQLYLEQKDNPEFVREIYYILDYIAIVKRTFHYNHYLLSLNLLNQFGIPIDMEHEYDPDFLRRIVKGSKQTQEGFSKLLLFGMLIDGSLSKKEEYLIYKMVDDGYFHYSREDAKRWTKSYFEGRGIEELVYGEKIKA